MKGPRRRLDRILPESAFGRSVIFIAAGTALGQAIVLLALPLLTRIYSAPEFGVYSIYTSLLAMALVVSTLRYELAIPLPDDENDAANVVVVCLTSTVLVTTVLGWGAWLFRSAFASATNAPPIGRYLWVLPISLLGAGIYQTFSYWAVRHKQFRLIGRTRVTQRVAQVGVQLGLGIGGFGVVGLLVGDGLGRLGGSGALAAFALRTYPAEFREVSLGKAWRLAKRYRRFPLLSTGAALANTASVQLPPILLSATFSVTVAGWFALAQIALAAPLTLIGQAVAQVYLGEAAVLRRDNLPAVRVLFDRSVRKLLKWGVLVVVLPGLLAPWLFPAVLGDQWRSAGEFAFVLMPMFFAQFVVVPIAQTLNIMERQHLQLGLDLSGLAITLAVFLLGPWIGLTSLQTLGLWGALMSGLAALIALVSRRTLTAAMRALTPLPQ